MLAWESLQVTGVTKSCWHGSHWESPGSRNHVGMGVTWGSRDHVGIGVLAVGGVTKSCWHGSECWLPLRCLSQTTVPTHLGWPERGEELEVAHRHPAPHHRCLWWPCAWPPNIVLQAGCHPTASAGLGWQPTAAGVQLAPGSALCMRMRCCRWQHMCQARRCCLNACMFTVAPLAVLAQTRVWRSFPIKPSAVSPWMAGVFMLVWRAGACSHDGLTYQTLLPSSLVATAPQFGCLQAQLMRVLRHCSAAAGPPTWPFSASPNP